MSNESFAVVVTVIVTLDSKLNENSAARAVNDHTRHSPSVFADPLGGLLGNVV